MTMKTTFDLPESLVRDVKRIAKDRGTTAREIVQQALTKAVEDADAQKPFTLRDSSVPGWLAPEFADTSFQELLEESYGDRYQ